MVAKCNDEALRAKVQHHTVGAGQECTLQVAQSVAHPLLSMARLTEKANV